MPAAVTSATFMECEGRAAASKALTAGSLGWSFSSGEEADRAATEGSGGGERRRSGVRTGSCRAPGWGGRIRTSEWRLQRPLPYHLATPHHGLARTPLGRADHSRRAEYSGYFGFAIGPVFAFTAHGVRLSHGTTAGGGSSGPSPPTRTC